MIDSGVGVVSLPLSVIPGCAVYVDGLLIHEDNQKGDLSCTYPFPYRTPIYPITIQLSLVNHSPTNTFSNVTVRP